MRYERSINCSPKHPCDLVDGALSERQNLHIRESGPTNRLCRGIHLRADARTLKKKQLPARSNQRHTERNQLRERTDSAGRRLVEPGGDLRLFRPRPEDFDVIESQSRGLVEKPVNPTFHRLNQDEVHVGARDRQHQTGQSGATADVTNPTGLEEGSKERAIQHVSAPQPGKLKGTNQPQLFSPGAEVVREGTREVDAVAEENGSSRRLALEFRWKRVVRHSNVSRETRSV